MKKSLINPEELNLEVSKLRQNGRFLVWCYLAKHSEPKAYFDPETGEYFCYACKTRKCLGELLIELQGTKTYKEYEIIKEQDKKEWIQFDKFPLAYDNKYLQSRNIKNTTVEEFKIRASKKAIFVPFYTNQKLVGYLQRNCYNSKKRYFYHGEIPLYYPYDLHYKTDHVYLVEGIFGFYNLYQNSLPTYSNLGSYIKDKAVDRLINRYEVFALFDDDKAGAGGYLELLKKSRGLVKVLIPGVEADEVKHFDWSSSSFTSSFHSANQYYNSF